MSILINEGVCMKKQKPAAIVVTRTFSSKSLKLFDLYANYVAKRIMIEKGMAQEEIKDSSDKETLDISDLMW